MPFADLDGFALHYQLEGDPAHPVVVFSNSLGADLSMWDAQVPALLQAFRVLRYDVRGHGRSATPPDTSNIRELANDLLSLLDHLHIDRAHLCGVSLGGLTAMAAALQFRDRLCSLILSNTAAKIGTADIWNERIAAIKAHGLASIADATMTRWFTPTFRADQHGLDKQRAMLLACPQEGYLEAAAVIRDSDLRSAITGIDLPVLVISGADDVVTPPSDGHALTRSIPGAIFHEMPGAHLSNIEYPEIYNQTLLTFLQQQQACVSGDNHHG